LRLFGFVEAIEECSGKKHDWCRRALSRQRLKFAAFFICQGPWNVDLRTPPGPEGSNGSLLDICRGHPDIFIYDLRFAIYDRETPARANRKSN